MPSTTPYLIGGYYLWIARSGQTMREARFGSHEEKTYLELKGECYVPGAGGRFDRKKLSRRDVLSFDERSNLMHMLAAANGGVMPPKDDAQWQRVLNVPLIVHVENRSYHPKIEGTQDENPAITYWTTDIKGAATGWPAGVPLPPGVEVASSSAASTPTAAAQPAPTPPPAQAPRPASGPPQPASGQSVRRPSPPRPEIAPTEAPPETQRARRGTPTSDAWKAKRERATTLIRDALESMGWDARMPGAEGDPFVLRFWEYFDQVPAVRALKHVREGKVPSFIWQPDAGATEDALDLLVEAMSQFMNGQDVRPPMPPVVRKGNG